jgi:hypothetical protein
LDFGDGVKQVNEKQCDQGQAHRFMDGQNLFMAPQEGGQIASPIGLGIHPSHTRSGLDNKAKHQPKMKQPLNQCKALQALSKNWSQGRSPFFGISSRNAQIKVCGRKTANVPTAMTTMAQKT